MIRRLFLTAILMLGVLALTCFISMNLKGGFLPDEDKGVLMCEVELPPGAALSRTNNAMLEFSEKVQKIKGVREVIAVSGFSIMSGASENLGFAIVTLDDWSKRTTPDLSISAIRGKIMEMGASIP